MPYFTNFVTSHCLILQILPLFIALFYKFYHFPLPYFTNFATSHCLILQISSLPIALFYKFYHFPLPYFTNSVAPDLQSDASYYQDFQSDRQYFCCIGFAIRCLLLLGFSIRQTIFLINIEYLLRITNIVKSKCRTEFTQVMPSRNIVSEANPYSKLCRIANPTQRQHPQELNEQPTSA